MSTTEGKAFTLRLPPELYEPIAAIAERERRSLQGQVLWMLDRALEDIDEAADVAAYDAAKAANEDALPLEEAFAEIEHERRGLRKAS